jgi:hypothetical protein
LIISVESVLCSVLARKIEDLRERESKGRGFERERESEVVEYW